MLCFVVVMQSFILNSHEVFIHIHQGCFAGTGAIVRLPQCQWSKLDGYGKISQCKTTIEHSKAKTVCIFLGIYCTRTSSRFTCSETSLFTYPIANCNGSIVDICKWKSELILQIPGLLIIYPWLSWSPSVLVKAAPCGITICVHEYGFGLLD